MFALDAAERTAYIAGRCPALLDLHDVRVRDAGSLASRIALPHPLRRFTGSRPGWLAMHRLPTGADLSARETTGPIPCPTRPPLTRGRQPPRFPLTTPLVKGKPPVRGRRRFSFRSSKQRLQALV